jgi:hypothetical protein
MDHNLWPGSPTPATAGTRGGFRNHPSLRQRNRLRESNRMKSVMKIETHRANRTFVTHVRRRCCVGIETLWAWNRGVYFSGGRSDEKAKRSWIPLPKRFCSLLAISRVY